MNLEDPLLLERQLCFALTVASRNVVAAYKPVLAELGITHPQYLALLALWERDPQSVRELADSLALESATLSPLLKRLEANGLIVRAKADDDDRALAVRLTPAGRALRERALGVPPTMLRKLKMTREAAQELHVAMTHLIQAAEAAIIEQ